MEVKKTVSTAELLPSISALKVEMQDVYKRQGIYAPTAEGGTAFFSPRLPPLFLFVCILAF